MTRSKLWLLCFVLLACFLVVGVAQAQGVKTTCLADNSPYVGTIKVISTEPLVIERFIGCGVAT